MAEKVPGWIGRILLPQLGEIKGEIVGLNGKVDGLAGRLEAVEGRLHGVEDSLKGVEGRLNGVEGRVQGVEGKLDALEGRMWGEFAAVHTDIKRLDDKMSVEIRRLDERMVGFERRQELADKIADITGRVATLEARK
jgi:hypothetical protein